MMTTTFTSQQQVIIDKYVDKNDPYVAYDVYTESTMDDDVEQQEITSYMLDTIIEKAAQKGQPNALNVVALMATDATETATINGALDLIDNNARNYTKEDIENALGTMSSDGMFYDSFSVKEQEKFKTIVHKHLPESDLLDNI